MGMLLAVIAAACALGAAVVGGFLGLIVGFAKTPRRKDGASGSRAASGVLFGTIGAAVGTVLGCGGFGLFMYSYFDQDGPPHGYPDRAAYRAAEMDAQTGRLAPLIEALEQYRGDRGRYPADLQELVDDEYLDALPRKRPVEDHLGQPNRLWAGEDLYRYEASLAGDQFGITVRVGFTEDKRWMTYHQEIRSYRSGTPGWQTGSRPPLRKAEAPKPQPTGTGKE